MTRYAIGIDLGGTHVKAASVSDTGAVLGRASDATGDRAGAAGTWIPTVRALVARLAEERGTAPSGVGLGAPGIAAADGRSIAFMEGRLAGLQGLDWTAALEARTAVRVLNDAHAALLGEAWTGAAAGCPEVVLLTLGTGVGGAILSRGRLVRGATGRAGHWGHISLDPDGAPSITGMPGSLEGAIGNYSLPARSEGRFTDTRALVEAHLAGDPLASRVWRRSIRCLAVAIASIANAVDPELATVEWRPLGRRVRVLPAALGDLAGAIGAARAALGAVDA